MERRRIGLTLSKAHDNGLLICVRCNYCRTRRYYEPADMRSLVGDIEIYKIERCTRCEACSRRDYLHVETWYPTSQERAGVVVRRIARVKTIRKVIWRDERLE